MFKVTQLESREPGRQHALLTSNWKQWNTLKPNFLVRSHPLLHQYSVEKVGQQQTMEQSLKRKHLGSTPIDIRWSSVVITTYTIRTSPITQCVSQAWEEGGPGMCMFGKHPRRLQSSPHTNNHYTVCIVLHCFIHKGLEHVQVLELVQESISQLLKDECTWTC